MSQRVLQAEALDMRVELLLVSIFGLSYAMPTTKTVGGESAPSQTSSSLYITAFLRSSTAVPLLRSTGSHPRPSSSSGPPKVSGSPPPLLKSSLSPSTSRLPTQRSAKALLASRPSQASSAERPKSFSDFIAPLVPLGDFASEDLLSVRRLEALARRLGLSGEGLPSSPRPSLWRRPRKGEQRREQTALLLFVQAALVQAALDAPLPSTSATTLVSFAELRKRDRNARVVRPLRFG